MPMVLEARVIRVDVIDEGLHIVSRSQVIESHQPFSISRNVRARELPNAAAVDEFGVLLIFAGSLALLYPADLLPVSPERTEHEVELTLGLGLVQEDLKACKRLIHALRGQLTERHDLRNGAHALARICAHCF